MYRNPRCSRVSIDLHTPQYLRFPSPFLLPLLSLSSGINHQLCAGQPWMAWQNKVGKWSSNRRRRHAQSPNLDVLNKDSQVRTEKCVLQSNSVLWLLLNRKGPLVLLYLSSLDLCMNEQFLLCPRVMRYLKYRSSERRIQCGTGFIW